MKLWQQHEADTRRSPVRVKRHSRFLFGWTVTILGTRWSRSWGILPAGTRLSVVDRPQWLGGMSWGVKRAPADHVLTRPTIAICKWRYR